MNHAGPNDAPASTSPHPAFLLVVGTDTGVGKTWTGRALAAAMTAAGRRVVAIKLVETGCADEERSDEDGVLLAKATGQGAPRRALERFAYPVTPAVAAQMEGRGLHIDQLMARLRDFGEGADVVLFEGAGGALSPLTWDATIVDIARAMNAHVVLVGSNRLGTIHHVRATMAVLSAYGLRPLAVVLSAPALADESTATNPEAIEQTTGFRPFVMDRLEGDDEARQAATALARHVMEAMGA